MKAAGRRKLLWALVLAVFMTGIPTGIVYATSTQEKLNQAQKDKKETQSQLSETEDNLKNLKEEKNVLYVTSEQFTNEFINSIKENDNEKFREKYRSVDVILIDDIQFIMDKEYTTKEFLNIFDTIYVSKAYRFFYWKGK